ncbi:hypothetical protein DFR67_1081, partial [Williamsia limnetica]
HKLTSGQAAGVAAGVGLVAAGAQLAAFHRPQKTNPL